MEAVRELAPLEFVNGGGTGSIERTTAEDAVTEIAAGSGLYQPWLFDSYRAFRGRPAALFALPVVRRPGPETATALGGGYPASGAAGKDRLPQPYLPQGLSYDPNEAAGEVQTPLLGKIAARLRVGDRVWFRHTKAGELCERFDTLHLDLGRRGGPHRPDLPGRGQDVPVSGAGAATDTTFRRTIVMISGAPGAGKTTIARPLARALNMPLFAKDSIKERIHDVLTETGPVEDGWSRRLGAVAMEMLWLLAHGAWTRALEGKHRAAHRQRSPGRERADGCGERGAGGLEVLGNAWVATTA